MKLFNSRVRIDVIASTCLLALCACHHDLAGPRPGDASGDMARDAGPDVTPDIRPDLPLDLPVVDVESADLPSPDLPLADLPTPDLPAPDLPAPDLPAPDLPAPDLAIPDQGKPDAPPSPQPIKGFCTMDKWCWSNPLPQGHSLYGVAMAGQQVFAVGAAGTLLHYDGKAWSLDKSTATKDIRAVWAASASKLFAVGDDGTVLLHDGIGWSATISGTTKNLRGVWGSGPKDVFMVGDLGLIRHLGSSGFSTMTNTNFKGLNGVWGSGPTDVYAVGNSGTILRYDGKTWTAETSGTSKVLRAVRGSGATDVWVVGDGGTVLHSSGNGTWTAVTSPGTTLALSGVVGDAKGKVHLTSIGGTVRTFDGKSWTTHKIGHKAYLLGIAQNGSGSMFAVGEMGAMARNDGLGWKALSSAVTINTLRQVWGSSPSNVYAAGDDGLVRFDGASWKTTSVGPTYKLRDVWGSNPTDVWVVGDSGTMLHNSGGGWKKFTPPSTGTLYYVMGSSPGNLYVTASDGLYRLKNYLWSPKEKLVYSFTSVGQPHVISASEVYVMQTSGSKHRALLVYNGTSWKSLGAFYTTAQVWATGPGNIYLWRSTSSVLHHYKGSKWTTVNTGLVTSTKSAIGYLWGSNPTNIYAAGAKGPISHYDGVKFTATKTGTTYPMYGGWTDVKGQTFAVGASGAILHRKP